MTKPTRRADSQSQATPKRRRTTRARPTPRWIQEPQEDLDAIGQRRCLMVLSVLSGERPVTEVIDEAQMSRPLYYQLEKKALLAMLTALTPGAAEDDDRPGMTRMRALEEKVERLEREKRRAERLLFMTRKVIKPGPLKTSRGRPPKAPASTKSGKKTSPKSRIAKTPAPTTTPTEATMTTGSERKTE